MSAVQKTQPVQAVFDAAAARLGRVNGPRVSFEFFPPKSDKLEEQLWQVIRRLEPLAPAFVSVTYGAGGSTRDRTHRTVARIVEETTLKPAAHLTCVSATREEIDEVMRAYWAAGVRHIVALRGDPPAGAGAKYEPHPGGYAYAADLVVGARRVADFEVSVAVYADLHPDSTSWQTEIDNFRRKIDAGATRGISNFFVDADSFLRLRDRFADAGINAPIVPGVMPVSNFNGFKRMAGVGGVFVPQWFADIFEGLDDDPETRLLVAAATTGELCARLAAEGVEDFHFYTLNRAELTLAICRMLGVKAQKEAVR
ncbi:MAG: methylenetetrahydrofolate reductase [NAD(P)H] [Hyphomonadaceae bacterium]|nr:methylenetetrahydrofolate reductase [NAD(P)H] [Hyphomonadaceae bacterium]